MAQVAVVAAREVVAVAVAVAVEVVVAAQEVEVAAEVAVHRVVQEVHQAAPVVPRVVLPARRVRLDRPVPQVHLV